MTADPGALLAAGAINAIAGGGSLVTFPTLIAVGLSPVTASITNTVALCPGYLGAALSQRRELAGQGRRAALVLPCGALGGLAGALLLLRTGDRAFDAAVPYLLLLSALLVGVQDPVRAWLFDHAHGEGRRRAERWAALPIALAGVYGGYFGAGVGVIFLAALGIVLSDTLVRISALKQLVSLVVNVVAAVAFLPSGRIDWAITAAMAGAALAGGAIGGRVASRVPARALRRLIVVLGVALSIVYFVR
jgi:uncharacterized membrane protein YfcA